MSNYFPFHIHTWHFSTLTCSCFHLPTTCSCVLLIVSLTAFCGQYSLIEFHETDGNQLRVASTVTKLRTGKLRFNSWELEAAGSYKTWHHNTEHHSPSKWRLCLSVTDEYWSQHPELHDIPIYYASSLAKKCMAVYQTYVNAMNDKIRRQIAINNPFVFRHISNLKVR